MSKQVLNYKRFNLSLPALYKENERNAGYDLFARLSKSVTLHPGEVSMIPLNLATEIPVNVVGLLFQRSSTYRKWGVKLTNSVGVIDSLYCGNNDEWAGEFQNVTNHLVTIHHGDKIAQAVFLPLADLVPLETDILANQDRGGFGTSSENADGLQGGGE